MTEAREKFIDVLLLFNVPRDKAEMLWEYAFIAGQKDGARLMRELRQAVEESYSQANARLN